MMICTRGRYAIRVMLDLAQHRQEGYQPMKEVAGRQGISFKYMEQILPALSRNGLVEGMHGKGGGYRLSRSPEEYTIWEILRLTEPHLVPVACLEEGAPPCSRADHCLTLPLWRELNRRMQEYLSGITLADLLYHPEKIEPVS